MKILITLMIILSVTSCGKSKSKKRSYSPQTDSSTGGVQAIPEDLTFIASRSYGPSTFSDYVDSISVSAEYEVPLEAEVITGNSGTGWLELIVGNRKFCYQGNASNNQTPNGTKFILQWEKTNLSAPCHSSSGKIPYSTTYHAQAGDEIRLSVNGGGCSNSSGACVYTEARLDLFLKD